MHSASAKPLAMLRFCFQPGEGHEAHCTPRNRIVLCGPAEHGYPCDTYPSRVEAGSMYPCHRRCRRRSRRGRPVLPAGRSGITDPSPVVSGRHLSFKGASPFTVLVISWSFQDVQSQRRPFWRWLSHLGPHLQCWRRSKTLSRAG